MKLRGMGTPVMLAIIAIAVVVAGTVYYNLRPEAEIMVEKGKEMMEEGEAMMKDGEAMMKDGEDMMHEGEAMMEKEDGAAMEKKDGEAMMEEGLESAPQGNNTSFQGEVLAGSSSGPVLLDFNREDYEKAIAEGKVVALFFYANWCPTCRIEFPKMKTAFDQMLTFSNSAWFDVVGFRVNYKDSQTDDFERQLARDFGVGYQHTKVLVHNGERVLKAPENWDSQKYIDEISKLLGL